MPVVFVLPGALRELAGHRDEICVGGSPRSVAAALLLLWAECPALRDRVITELGGLRPHINIFVDGEDIRYAGGLDAPVRDGAEVFLLPAISGGSLTDSRRLLQHFLAALAYRTQKALRGAPAGFGEFRAGRYVRTPHELVWHMTGVIGYARTMLHGGTFEPPRRPAFADEIVRFHATVEALRDDFADAALEAQIEDEQFLQGPLSDAMTHAGQLAILRRLAGAPVPSENFIFADIRVENVSAAQPDPASPDAWWSPDQPPQPPGPPNKKS